jgi:hypothetical protein
MTYGLNLILCYLNSEILERRRIKPFPLIYDIEFISVKMISMGLSRIELALLEAYFL